MTDITEARDIIGIALAASQPHRLDLGGYYAIATADGEIEEIDLTGDEHRDLPRRITRHVSLTDVMSLQDYWDKHATAASECYANRDSRTLTAVLDAHPGANADFSPADWCQHTATTTFELSKPLQTWLNHNSVLMRQEPFAEWVEDNIAFIVEPPVADLKELAETFQATTTAKFQAGVRLSNGQRTLSYVEQVDASVRDGQIPVPTTITAALPIWRGATQATKFTARIRYRTNTPSVGALSICYVMDRPQDIIDAAFETEVGLMGEHIDRPVFNGTAYKLP